MIEVTDWYHPDTPPVYAGWYERDYGDGVFKDWWTGSVWKYGCGLPNTYSSYQTFGRLPWRGVKRGCP